MISISVIILIICLKKIKQNIEIIKAVKKLNCIEFLTANKKPNFAIIAPFIQEKNNQESTMNKKNGVFEVKNVKGFAMFLNLEQCKDVGFFDENFYVKRVFD